VKLIDVENFVRRFVILPEPANLPVALWVVSTYCPDNRLIVFRTSASSLR